MAALDTVRLSGYGDRRPTQLSGGQRQRVALARALVNRPKVLLLDEPLGALDLKLRREMQIELKQIQREVGITFCFVTHDQEEALTMSDRIAVFNDGRVEQVATPTELYESPASSFVAGFVGTSNLLTGADARAVDRPRRDLQHPAREDPTSDEDGHRAAPRRPASCSADRLPRLGQPLPRRARRRAARSRCSARTSTAPPTRRLGRRGERVDLTWADEHVIDLGTDAGALTDRAPAREGGTP